MIAKNYENVNRILKGLDLTDEMSYVIMSSYIYMT